MQNEIQQQVTDVRQELLAVLASFTQDNINTVPFEGSWTAAQVGDHIIKYSAGILETVNGPAKPSERAPDAMVQQLKDIFLDFNAKYQSPDFILPRNEPLQYQDVVNQLDALTSQLENAAGTKHLEELCTSGELPTVGFMTRLEWLSFFVVHTQRHIRQLRKIADHLHVHVSSSI